MKFSKLKTKIKKYADGGSVPPNTDLGDEISGEGIAPVIKNLIVDKKPEDPDAIEPSTSPLDFITPSMVAAPARALGRGAMALGREAVEAAPRLVGNEIGAIGKDLKDMSLLERIKAAAAKSGVKAPEMEAANAEREALRNKPKDFFDRARAKDTQRILEENEKKLAEEAAAREAYKAEFDANPTVYHGSPHGNIKEFIPSKYGVHGEGIYTTTIPELSNPYAEGYWSKDPTLMPKNVEPTIYPLKYRGRTFDVHNPQDWLDLIRVKKPSYSYPDILPFKKNWYTHKDIQPELTALGDLDKALKESNLFTAYKDNDLIKILDPKNVRLPWAKFDPAMRESADTLAGLGAAGLTFDQLKKLLDKKSTNTDEGL